MPDSRITDEALRLAAERLEEFAAEQADVLDKLPATRQCLEEMGLTSVRGLTSDQRKELQKRLVEILRKAAN